MTSATSIITKSKYLQYLRCPKLLHTAINAPDLILPLSTADLHRMNEGKKVEALARQLFPNGIQIDHEQSFSDILKQSNDAISNVSSAVINKPIFNAIVQKDDLMAEIDVLMPVADNTFDIFEVKSSTNIKDKHVPDVAFQKYVAEESGLKIRQCKVVTLNSDFVKQGNPSNYSQEELEELFTVNDVTADVEYLGDYIEKQIAEMKNIIGSDEIPSVSLKMHCVKPDDCPMKSACWKYVDEKPYNIFHLYRMRYSDKFRLYYEGILKTKDVPDVELNEKQLIQKTAEESGQDYMDKAEIGQFLNRLQFPLFFLDFETVNPALPIMRNSNPYQQIPFQYSLHVLRKTLDEEPEHYGWIWDGEGGNKDPREILLRELKEKLGDKGSIIVFNETFERMILRKSVEAYPDYKEWLDGINIRIVDLLIPFRAFHYYSPAQKGSCSLKDVLPALTLTGKTYEGMEIGDGITASIEFLNNVLNGEDDGQKQETIKNLEAYCEQDTMAEIDILRVLKGQI